MIQFRYKIEQDEDPMHPRKEFDQVCKMACWHSRYKLGDEQPKESGAEFLWNLAGYTEETPWWPENEIIEKAISRLKKNGYEILPLYLYDHGGITMNTTGFTCRWDSGQVGWIYVDKESIVSNWPKEAHRWRKKAIEVMLGEVKEYDMFLTGDVHGYIISKWEEVDGEWEEVDDRYDSCWGFYGEEYCEEEAKAECAWLNDPKNLQKLIDTERIEKNCGR